MDCPEDEEASPESLSLSDAGGEELEEREEQEQESEVGREEGERLPNRRSPYSLGEVLPTSLYFDRKLPLHTPSSPDQSLFPPPQDALMSETERSYLRGFPEGVEGAEGRRGEAGGALDPRLLSTSPPAGLAAMPVYASNLGMPHTIYCTLHTTTHCTLYTACCHILECTLPVLHGLVLYCLSILAQFLYWIPSNLQVIEHNIE